jgi:hypothetical protein
VRGPHRALRPSLSLLRSPPSSSSLAVQWSLSWRVTLVSLYAHALDFVVGPLSAAAALAESRAHLEKQYLEKAQLETENLRQQRDAEVVEYKSHIEQLSSQVDRLKGQLAAANDGECLVVPYFWQRVVVFAGTFLRALLWWALHCLCVLGVCVWAVLGVCVGCAWCGLLQRLGS